MELEHVNVKLLVKDPDEVSLDPLIPVFHSWIEGQVLEELLLDVADYRHVHAGPGVILIGHEANYSVDNTEARLGVRYNRKAVLEGSNQDRLRHAMRAALNACQRLEMEPSLEGTLQFGGQEMEFFVNDRLLAPNCDTTREEVHSEFEAFFEKLFRGSQYSLSYASDPRRLFGVSVKSSQSFTTADLLANLDA
ncbi:MAG: hypothetical protein DMG31_04285 [Acidobacteria bacterium]|nr:MAG: hypothetical protein DMG31_04285 [Acidobacteriota bacterium]